jgi:hypothetical protein
MKVINDNLSLMNFDAWSGAKETKRELIDLSLVDDFEALIDELYPEGLTDTQLNDILWFERDWIFESLGIETNED